MRLSCPNCAADYEVGPGLVPPDGRHVQCTACHTRWFARPDAGAGPEEDAILHRLESRGPRKVSPVAPVVVAPKAAPAAPASRWEHEESPVPAAPHGGGEPGGGDPEPRAPVKEPRAPVKEPRAPVKTPPPPQADPGPGEAAPLRAAGAARRPAPPSGRPRLDLTAQSDAGARLPKPPSRFGHGLAAATVCVLAVVAAYALRGPIAARVPAAAPALAAYASAVDGLRERIADLLRDG